MLRYLTGTELGRHEKLAHSMFRDRAVQFRDRLKWDVQVDEQGFERDQYDALDPLYVLWENPDGTHGGSMRFLPTTGRTMAREHFSHLNGDEDISSPFIWECTRFCLSPDADKHVAAALMLGGGELMRAFAVTHYLGIFDQRMVRIYRMLGSSPEILGSIGTGKDQISLGLWAFTNDARQRLLDRSGIRSQTSEFWFSEAFGRMPEMDLQIAV